MGKYNISIVVIIVFVFNMVGCINSEEKIIPLTKEELSFFNGTEYFNKEYKDNVITINIRNQFLSSMYSNAKDIDLFQLFYCGVDVNEEFSGNETVAIAKAFNLSGDANEWPCACTKITVEQIERVLEENMGLTLNETNQVGLSNFIYLEQYDAYYLLHGDTNYRYTITFESGERQGNTIRLFYDDVFFCDGKKVLTLQKKNKTYYFVSNQKR